jgi:hypothetical protein
MFYRKFVFWLQITFARHFNYYNAGGFHAGKTIAFYEKPN